MIPRRHGFMAGFLAGLGGVGLVWLWIVQFRPGYEIVVIADRRIESVYAVSGLDALLFPTSAIEIRQAPEAAERILIMDGFRSLGRSTTVTLAVRQNGLREHRYVALDLKSSPLDRRCTAVVRLGIDSAETGACTPAETAWIKW